MQTNPKSNKMRTKSSLPNLSSPVTLTALCRRVPYPRTVLVLTWNEFKFWKTLFCPHQFSWQGAEWLLKRFFCVLLVVDLHHYRQLVQFCRDRYFNELFQNVQQVPQILHFWRKLYWGCRVSLTHSTRISPSRESISLRTWNLRVQLLYIWIQRSGLWLSI